MREDQKIQLMLEACQACRSDEHFPSIPHFKEMYRTRVSMYQCPKCLWKTFVDLNNCMFTGKEEIVQVPE